jgi:hypothetical protein
MLLPLDLEAGMSLPMVWQFNSFLKQIISPNCQRSNLVIEGHTNTNQVILGIGCSSLQLNSETSEVLLTSFRFRC